MAETNLAVVATPSASYVSGDTSLAALNDGAHPKSSLDNHQGSYGNWPRTGEQWVEYQWPQAISTAKVAVYWWNDHRGIKQPLSCRILYWNGSSFVPVTNVSGLGVEINRYNETTFDEISTTRLRLEMESDGTFSTGILQWKVIDSGKTAPFPPLVLAGVDRSVVLGGKTYLSGRATSLWGTENLKANWSKKSGPGEVTFDDANALAATASFSEVGDYVLSLTAGDAKLNGSSQIHVHVVAPAPSDPLTAFNFTKTWTIDSRLWNDRYRAIIAHWIPHCYQKLSEPNLPEGGIGNFIAAGNKLAGKPFSPRVGPPWADAYVHNTVESMCLALMVNPNGDEEIATAQKAIRAKLNEWIPIILAAQEPDGYLQTQFALSGHAHWDPRYRGDHEGYASGYFIESALAHYLMTGKADDRMYRAARKLADCWYNNIGPAPKKHWFDGHEEMEQALIKLGQFVNADEGAGKGQKYLDLAKFLLDCRRGGTSYDQSHLPVTHQYEAMGHAVRASYLYSAMAQIATLTGDRDYQSAILSLYNSVQNRKMYVTSGVGSVPGVEGFGAEYSLPNVSYCESCAGCGMIFFQHAMNLQQKDARYADAYEQTLFNSVLGDVDLQGEHFYYQNLLDSGDARYPWHTCPCCVGNIPRTLLELPSWIYARGDNSLYVNLFAGSDITIDRLAGTDVRIVQKTEYPQDGKVQITLNPEAPAKFALHVRIPNRDVSELYSSEAVSNGVISLAVNGTAITPTMDRGYAVIDRTWKAGDTVELNLPMQVQRLRAADEVAADRGKVALRVGPLIYDIEAVDQDIHKSLAPDAALSLSWRGDLLNGVNVIEGKFSDGSPLLAIPYYARNNRGGDGSIVWINEAK